MSTVRQKVLRSLRDGTLTADSILEEVSGIGPYIHRRFQRTVNAPGGDVTLRRLWRFFSSKTSRQTLQLIRRALQNERANQCVAPVPQHFWSTTYHTGDINKMGYEAIVALLDHARARGRVRYGPLPLRLVERSTSSKECACKVRCDGVCRLTSDGLCVPRAHNARGFEGVAPQDGQKVVGRNARGYLPLSAALQADPDSMQDLNRGHRRNVLYSRQGPRTRWRRPGSKVRVSR